MIPVSNIAAIACALDNEPSGTDGESIALESLISRWSGAPTDSVSESIRAAKRSSDSLNAHLESITSCLTHSLREQLLADLIHFALDDNLLDARETALIGQFASAWGVHPPPMDEMSLRYWSLLNLNGDQGWSPLHDLALVYFALAHQTDHDLVPDEIEAINAKIGEWMPAAMPEDVVSVVRTALNRYSENADLETLNRSVISVRDSTPAHQHQALLSDLHYIAASDGVVLVEEKAIIEKLAVAWNIS